MRFKRSSIIIVLLLLIIAAMLFRFFDRIPLIKTIDVKLPQNAHAYITPQDEDKPLLSKGQEAFAAQSFLKKYFSPWDKHRTFDTFALAHSELSIKVAEQTVVKGFVKNPGYGENFRKHSQQWIENIVSNMDLQTYPNRNLSAIVVRNTSLRVMPTDKPSFESYKIAGQGYPFDNFQISSLWVGAPLHILQISKDGAWALVVAPTMFGWIKTQNMAYVDQAFIQQYKTGHYVALIKDSAPIKDATGLFRFEGRIGMLFPQQGDETLIPVATIEHHAVIKKIKLNAEVYRDFPWQATPAHFAEIINQLLGEPYGWGGLYGYRDCSATVKDFYIPFGIWMPRNSTQQKANGDEVDLTKMSDKQKSQYIVQHGKPFFTLIGLPGHIMLYIGTVSDKPVVFHNKWGLHTGDVFGDKGRAVIGEAAITQLTLGHNILHAVGDLLDAADTFTLVGPAVQQKQKSE